MAIIINGLEKKYGNKHALYPLDLKIEHGKTIALCGSNGAGKSTLLKILSKAISQDGGYITGLDSFNSGYMPDTLSIDDGLTGTGLLNLFCDLKNMPRHRVDFVLEETGLKKFGRDRIGTYSRGMLQRFLFAQMILSDPQVLLMDEPESGLDPFWIYEWKKKMKEYKRSGKTLIFSTHFLNGLNDTADVILFFHEGKLLYNSDTASGLIGNDYEKLFFELCSSLMKENYSGSDTGLTERSFEICKIFRAEEAGANE